MCVRRLAGRDASGSDSALSQKLYLAYNCRAIDGRRCIDNTPEHQQREGMSGPMNARLQGNLNACITRDLKNIMYCFDGIKVRAPVV